MSIEKSHLIELYKTTLEEARHHDTINMQIFMALGVVISLLLVAIGFIFSDSFCLRSECVLWAKWGILIAFLVGEVFFFFVFRRFEGIFKTCSDVSKKIEDKLVKLDGEFGDLLVGLELRKINEGSCYARNRFNVYIAVGIAALLALFVFLFVFI